MLNLVAVIKITFHIALFSSKYRNPILYIAIVLILSPDAKTGLSITPYTAVKPE